MKQESQSTPYILMVEPVAFYFNAETAVNNYFQKKPKESTLEIQQAALSEFTKMVEKLRNKGVEVLTIKDTPEPHTPDSIFPNNWISTHSDGQVALYPMNAVNRRAERRTEVLDFLEEQGFGIESIIDYSAAEKENVFLEGTGSIILDRENRIAYAALSPRTDESLFIEFCEDFEFTPAVFHSYQTVGEERKLIYHTNVMMCVADQYVVICMDTLDDKKERKHMAKTITNSGKEIIKITEEQMHQFAGNMLQVQNKSGEKFLVMSQSARNSLTPEQVSKIEKYNEIISADLTTIETLGGGSARCMMAEVFLPINK